MSSDPREIRENLDGVGQGLGQLVAEIGVDELAALIRRTLTPDEVDRLTQQLKDGHLIER